MKHIFKSWLKNRICAASWCAGLSLFTNCFAMKENGLLGQVHKAKQITYGAGIYQRLTA